MKSVHQGGCHCGAVRFAVELDLSEYEGRYPEEMFGRSHFPRIGSLPYLLTLAPRGFFWFRLITEEEHERDA